MIQYALNTQHKEKLYTYLIEDFSYFLSLSLSHSLTFSFLFYLSQKLNHSSRFFPLSLKQPM